MGGNKFMSFDMNFSRTFSDSTRLGFFHMNTIQFDYDDDTRNSFVLQDLLTYEVIKNLKIVGGIFYGKPGVNSTIGFQYNYFGKRFLFLFAPRVNITEVPSYEFMTLIQYKARLTDNLKLFTRLKLLNVFDANEHIRSYQWFRVGLDHRGYQFGLAADFDEYGPSADAEFNFGLFIRKEIF
jgi:hypothetical protein